MQLFMCTRRIWIRSTYRLQRGVTGWGERMGIENSAVTGFGVPVDSVPVQGTESHERSPDQQGNQTCLR